MNSIFPGGTPMVPAVIILIAGVLLVVAAALTLIRMAKGPGTLDRVVAADVLIATLIAGIALEAALNGNITTIPLILVISMLGFAGALSVARFAASRDKAVKLTAAKTDGSPESKATGSGPGSSGPGSSGPDIAGLPWHPKGRFDDHR